MRRLKRSNIFGRTQRSNSPRRPVGSETSKRRQRGNKIKYFSRHVSSRNQPPRMAGADVFTRRRERLDDIKTAKQKRKVLKGALIISSAVFLLWAVVYARISGVDINGDASIEQRRRIAEVTDSYFDQTSRWRTGFSPRTLDSYLQASMPEYDEIGVELPIFSRSVQLDLTSEKPHLVWQSAGRKYSISQEGVVLGQTDTPGELPVVFDSSSLALSPGDRIVNAQFVKFITDMNDTIQQGGTHTPKAYRVETSTRVVRIDLTGKKYEIITTTEIQPTGQWATVVDLLQQLNKDGLAKPSNYIDTRVAGRVFWQ